MMRVLSCVLALALSGTALANDGFGGLSAAGLQFQDTADIAMVSEDLFLSPDKIKVAYVFQNKSAADVTGEVIFPLPPISLNELMERDFALDGDNLDKPNFVGFTATVDGRAVNVTADRIAVLQVRSDTERPAADSYETPGKDVTEVLKTYGIPLSLDTKVVTAALAKLPQAAKDDLTAQELADFSDPSTPYPYWSIIERYHWTQTFKAGATVKVDHTYKAAPPGGVFGWQKEGPNGYEEYQKQLVDEYCIDKGTASAIEKALTPGEDKTSFYGQAKFLDYVLTTANSWAGPIGSFKLTIDKGDPKNVLSLCFDGLKKVGPTTFVAEKKNFTPMKEINMLFVLPTQ